MAFRIETTARGRVTFFVLSGRIEKQAVKELSKLLESRTDWRDIVLDLKEVGIVDRDAVRFFARCEAGGIRQCGDAVRIGHQQHAAFVMLKGYPISAGSSPRLGVRLVLEE